MPVAMPQVVRRGWGEEVVAAFVPWLKEEISETVKEKAVPGTSIGKYCKEEQVRMRAEFREDQAQMRAEFREDLGELRREMHNRFDNIHHQMLVQTRWLIGSLALIGTVVSVLLAIAQFTP